MPDHQRERETPKPVETPKTRKVSLPTIVEMHISDVMVDRTKMKAMEQDLDVYVKTLSQEEKQEQRQIVTTQLTNGRLALESLLQRFLAS